MTWHCQNERTQLKVKGNVLKHRKLTCRPNVCVRVGGQVYERECGCRCGCWCKRCEKINLGKHIDSKSHDVNFRNNVGSCWPGHFGRLLRPVNRKALHDLPRLVCSHCCGATVLLLSQWIARLCWRPSSRPSHFNWTRYGRMWREAHPFFLYSACQWRINSYVHPV